MEVSPHDEQVVITGRSTCIGRAMAACIGRAHQPIVREARGQRGARAAKRSRATYGEEVTDAVLDANQDGAEGVIGRGVERRLIHVSRDGCKTWTTSSHRGLAARERSVQTLEPSPQRRPRLCRYFYRFCRRLRALVYFTYGRGSARAGRCSPRTERPSQPTRSRVVR